MMGDQIRISVGDLFMGAVFPDCCWERSTRSTFSACPGPIPGSPPRPRTRSRYPGASSRTCCDRRFRRPRSSSRSSAASSSASRRRRRPPASEALGATLLALCPGAPVAEGPARGRAAGDQDHRLHLCAVRGSDGVLAGAARIRRRRADRGLVDRIAVRQGRRGRRGPDRRIRPRASSSTGSRSH